MNRHRSPIASRALSALLGLTLAAASAQAGSGAYAGWDLFTCPDLGCSPNVPDLAGSTNLDATVEQQVPGAILTSSSNIYHPGAATFFVLRDTAPAAISSVRLVLAVDGTPLDTASVLLRFGSESRTPSISGGMGVWTFDWNLGGDQVTDYQIEWEATGAHMSLDRVELSTADDDSIGTRYCTSTINSTGGAAIIEASGSAHLADDALFLTASSVPNQWGIFFTGLNAVQIPFGNGYLCTNGSLLRGQVVHPTGQTFTYHWPTAGLAAGTRYFQYWFRDPQGGGAFFNTSDGIAIPLL